MPALIAFSDVLVGKAAARGMPGLDDAFEAAYAAFGGDVEEF